MSQIGLSFIGDVKVPDAVAYIFGGSGVAYGFSERRLRYKKTERLAAHAIELEKVIDSKRQSSGLTPKGTTRPEDKR